MMENKSLARLAEESQRYRSALEKCKGQFFCVGLHDFPVGACGIVSEMLGRHLLSLGFQEVEYVNAERGPKLDGNWTTHAWLDVAGYTVDITADQFPDWTGEKVAVTLATDWHNGF